MTFDQFSVVLFVLFVASRIRGYVRRSRLPMLRGPGCFLSVRVKDDFHLGPGAPILRRYRFWLVAPIVLEILLGAAILLSGHWKWLNALIVAATALAFASQAVAVRRAEREARPFQLEPSPSPAPAVVLSLAPRRLRDYANAPVEMLIAVLTLIPFGWLSARYLRGVGREDFGSLFGIPLILLYFQVGILYLKHVTLSWRVAARSADAGDQLAVQDAVRRHRLGQLDAARLLFAFCALYWPMLVAAAPGERSSVLAFWLVLWIVAGLATTFWVESRREKLRAFLARTAPVDVPAPLAEPGLRGWPFCYAPASPALMIAGADRSSVNLASTPARWAIAYVAGFVILLVVVA